MRIVFFSHYYPPEVNAPASRTSEHCEAWVRAGHDVTVITCTPNHPSGRAYPGYRNRLIQTETLGGVRVVRVWTLLAANQGLFLRSLNYLSYLFSATIAFQGQRRPDVVVSTSPQFFCGLTGLFARGLRRIPWVLEIRDLWPDSIVTVGAMRKGVAVRLLELLETFAYRKADRIVSVTDSFVSHITARTNDPAKITVIKNGVDLGLFTSSAGHAGGAKRELGLEGKFVAAYVGTHGMAHHLDTILEAADLLRDRPDIAFLMVGDGAERSGLVERALARSLSNVHIIGQLPKAHMPGIWASTDASLILLRRSELFHKVLPSKMFEAMAMRSPIILGVEGEARRLLEAAGAGIAITPESASELAEAVVALAKDPALHDRLGEQGEAYVRRHHDRAVLAARFADLLVNEITQRRGGEGTAPAPLRQTDKT